MDNKIYTVTLSNGVEISNIKLNGNNFVSSKEINKSMFENNCSPITISDGEKSETYIAMELIHVTKMENEWYFALRDLTEDELVAIKNRADLDYLALMCDVEL